LAADDKKDPPKVKIDNKPKPLIFLDEIDSKKIDEGLKTKAQKEKEAKKAEEEKRENIDPYAKGKLDPVLSDYEQSKIDKRIKWVKKKYEENLRKDMVSPNVYFTAVKDMAREFYKWGHYDQALKYYLEAKDLFVNRDKTHIYLELLDLTETYDKAREKRKQILKEFKVFLEKNYKWVDPDAIYYYQYRKIKYSNQHSTKVLTDKNLEFDFYENFGRFNTEVFWHDVKYHITKGQYSKAFNKLNEKIKTTSPISERVIRDMMLFLSKGKRNKSKLYCETYYNNYARLRTISYTMLVCGIMIKKRKGEKIDPLHVEKIKEAINYDFPDKKYLLKPIDQILSK
jgi:hypothetical protein